MYQNYASVLHNELIIEWFTALLTTIQRITSLVISAFRVIFTTFISMKNPFISFFLATFFYTISFTQTNLNRNELLGGFLPERTEWNLIHYDYTIDIDPKEHFISGYNIITFELNSPISRMQIDLHELIKIDSIILDDNKLHYERIHAAVFVELPEINSKTRQKLTFYHHGNPIKAINAPWDGGYVMQLDKNVFPQIGMAVQGIGSSVWLPSKDGQSDEPEEGVTANIIVPKPLVAVSNGRLISTIDLPNEKQKWTWEVKNPINSYCITFNIGDYVPIHARHKNLELTYWVLRSNEMIAKHHFAVVPEMLSIFEKYFGPYPFPEDSYKIVEAPFAGMEHQSNIAYSNFYKNGYAGNGNEIARRFDFILIHESAHEWFGNSITSRDISDMWIHEAFTTYAELLFVEEKWGKDAALRYVDQVQEYILNQKPIIGHHSCNHKGDTDMYYKGAMMLQTLRSHVQNDSLFFKTLKDFSLNFKKQIIETKDVIQFFSDNLSQNLEPFFTSYLYQSELPYLVINKQNELFFTNVQPGFELKIELNRGRKTKKYFINEKPQIIKKGSNPFTEKQLDQLIDKRKYLVKLVALDD